MAEFFSNIISLSYQYHANKCPVLHGFARFHMVLYGFAFKLKDTGFGPSLKKENATY